MNTFSKSLTVLVIDDEPNMLKMLEASLAKFGFNTITVASGEEGLNRLQQKGIDIVLCDYRMPGLDGLEFLQKAITIDPEITVILMSAYATVETAVKAMKAGAFDVITKPFKVDEVRCVLEKVQERISLKVENALLKQELENVSGNRGFRDFIGKSSTVQRVLSVAKRVAGVDSTVLITGESGTGKELIARGIQQLSARKNKPFVTINCGAIPEQLLESEFFGVIRGAFTGAERDRRGLFREAHGGTLFLDEIGELPLALQVKLLRVLQEQEVRPVGGDSVEKVDVRILAATSKNLQEEVESGRFRRDLLFRLNVVEIEIPPLRMRREDIPALARHFLDKLGKNNHTSSLHLSRQVQEIFMKYEWPGNVRELEHCLEFAAICCEGNKISEEDLPERIFQKSASSLTTVNDGLFQSLSLRENKNLLEQKLIPRALEAAGGNKSKAAKLLEMSYPALLERIKRYKL